MSDIKAAAERFKLAEEIGDHTVYDGDEERADVDAYALAREYLKLLDPTPLKDVWDERWEGMVFEHDSKTCLKTYLSPNSDWYLCYHFDRDELRYGRLDEEHVDDADVILPVATLGQLRHLKSALGGPVEKT